MYYFIINLLFFQLKAPNALKFRLPTWRNLSNHLKWTCSKKQTPLHTRQIHSFSMSSVLLLYTFYQTSDIKPDIKEKPPEFLRRFFFLLFNILLSYSSPIIYSNKNPMLRSRHCVFGSPLLFSAENDPKKWLQFIYIGLFIR